MPKIHSTYSINMTLYMFLAERDIAAFMALYRQTFPEATVLAKMHILEDHVIPWLRRWHIGSGLMGEQRAESIHAHLHRLQIQYNGIFNPLERLKYVIKEHNIESFPRAQQLTSSSQEVWKTPQRRQFIVNLQFVPMSLFVYECYLFYPALCRSSTSPFPLTTTPASLSYKAT